MQLALGKNGCCFTPGSASWAIANRYFLGLPTFRCHCIGSSPDTVAPEMGRLVTHHLWSSMWDACQCRSNFSSLWRHPWGAVWPSAWWNGSGSLLVLALTVQALAGCSRLVRYSEETAVHDRFGRLGPNWTTGCAPERAPWDQGWGRAVLLFIPRHWFSRSAMIALKSSGGRLSCAICPRSLGTPPFSCGAVWSRRKRQRQTPNSQPFHSPIFG